MALKKNIHTPLSTASFEWLRARATSLLLLFLALFFSSIGLVGSLTALGALNNVFQGHLLKVELSLSCLLLALLALFAFRIHRRSGSPWPIRVLCLSLAVLLPVTLPSEVFSHGLPQALWLPPLVAAVLCGARFVALVMAVTAGFTLALHGHMPPFGFFAPYFVWLALAALVVLFRWLQDKVVLQQLRARERAQHDALHDTLTSLPNRRLIQDRLRRALAAARRQETMVAVLFVDLDHFARVNDTLGHDVGDSVLTAIAKRLAEIATPTAKIGRFGGDEFVVILTDISDTGTAQRFADTIIERVREPVNTGAQLVHTSASVGVAFYPSDGPDARTILRFADQALYQAKAEGRNLVQCSSVELRQRAKRWFELAQELPEASQRDEFWLAYQPIQCLRTGSIKKAEALLRWDHPRLGRIPPNEFIPIAETTGLINELGDWVLATAGQQALRLRAQGWSEFCISVNRSAVQFHHDGGDANAVVELLTAQGIAPNAVSLELTEHVLLDTDSATARQLNSIRAAGVHLSLDDFGTGYSSLRHLHHFDLDVVKIDRSFVTGLKAGSKNFILCQGIIRLAHALGLTVVAEGVETEDERQLLSEMGCDFAQGYYIARPMPEEKLKDWLKQQMQVAVPGLSPSPAEDNRQELRPTLSGGRQQT